MTDRTDAQRGNGHVPDPDVLADPADVEAALDALDAEPLDADEAAAGAAAAGDVVDETLGARVAAVVADLGDVERVQHDDELDHLAGGRLFAVLGEDRLEVGLDPTVARAALRTPDTSASPRGAGWVRFSPAIVDRYALDRAEAWVRFAYRLAAG